MRPANDKRYPERYEPVDEFMESHELNRRDTEFNAARKEVTRRNKIKDRRRWATRSKY